MVNLSEVMALNHQKPGEQFATTIRHIPKNSQNVYKLEQSAVIFCNDLEDIREFNDKVQLSNDYPKKMKFLVICEKSIDRRFPMPHKLSWRKGLILEFQYFLINKAGKLELLTFEWFMKGKCNQPQLTKLNSFSKTTLKWNKQLAIKDKFTNFNQCTITSQINIRLTLESCIVNNELISSETKIFEAVSSLGNFGVNFVFVPVNKITHETEMHVDAQFKFFETVHEFKKSKIMHITTAHSESVVGFVVPPNELYTSYEKLLMPFDELTWIFIIATFGFSFGFIFAIKRYAPLWLQNYIFGTGISAPAYNLLGTFFGQSQVRVPVENSARIILISYLFFCLIIRTAYQGVFFEMFTHNLTKPQPKTIEDLYEQNYTVYSFSTTSAFNNLDKNRRPRFVLVDFSEIMALIEQKEITGKIAFIATVNDKARAVLWRAIGFRDVLNERLIAYSAGYKFQKNNFLYHIFDETIQNLISGGIINKLNSFSNIFCVFERYEDEEWEPYVFSIDDLLFGFNIWLTTVGVALVVFALRLIWFHGQRTTIRIVRNAIALYFMLKRLQRGFGL